MNNAMKKNSAFTLIEMTVVITIIIILLSLIIVSVKSASSKADRAKCIHNLKELHKAVYLYLTDEERIHNETSPKSDLPSDSLLQNTYKINNADYYRSVLNYYAGSSFEKLKCPKSETDNLGYRINQNVINSNCEIIDKSKNTISFENLKNSNILLYEINSDNSIAYRHSNKCFGIDFSGEIDYDIAPEDLINKNE